MLILEDKSTVLELDTSVEREAIVSAIKAWHQGKQLTHEQYELVDRIRRMTLVHALSI